MDYCELLWYDVGRSEIRESEMNKKECTKAIKKAQRIFVSVEVLRNSKRNARLSKSKALTLIRCLPDNADIKAEWLTDDHQFLMIG